MEPNVQLSEPAADLYECAAEVVPGWLRRGVASVARRGGVDAAADERAAALDALVPVWTVELLHSLESLLALDVDQQHSNPLAIFRAAVEGPTELLRSWNVPTPRVDAFVAERFPADVYGLGPASWVDVDPALHDVGITWSAWKAMTVLRRRRDEGLR